MTKSHGRFGNPVHGSFVHTRHSKVYRPRKLCFIPVTVLKNRILKTEIDFDAVIRVMKDSFLSWRWGFWTSTFSKNYIYSWKWNLAQSMTGLSLFSTWCLLSTPNVSSFAISKTFMFWILKRSAIDNDGTKIESMVAMNFHLGKGVAVFSCYRFKVELRASLTERRLASSSGLD
jgi:hypothetical protein